MENKWSEEDVIKIEKLLCSEDIKNVSLAVELIKTKNDYSQFTVVLCFLKAQYFYSSLSEINPLLEKVESTPLFQSYWNSLQVLHQQKNIKTEGYISILKEYEIHKMLFEQFMSYNPKFSHFYRHIANELGHYLNKKNETIAYLKDLLKFDPTHGESHFDYAYLLSDQIEYADEIIFHYKEALANGFHDRAIRHNIGRAYCNLKKNEKEAERWFRENLQFYPTFHFTMLSLASITKYTNAEEAEYLFLEAIKIDPNCDLAYNNLAFFYIDIWNEPEKAYRMIKKAIELVPDSALYWHTLAEVEWYGYKNAEAAIKALNTAQQVDPEYKDGDQMLAYLWEECK